MSTRTNGPVATVTCALEGCRRARRRRSKYCSEAHCLEANRLRSVAYQRRQRAARGPTGPELPKFCKRRGCRQPAAPSKRPGVRRDYCSDRCAALESERRRNARAAARAGAFSQDDDVEEYRVALPRGYLWREWRA